NSYAIVAETLGGISAIGIVNDAALTAIATANGDDSHAVAIGISACRSSSPLARTSGMRAPTPGSTEPQICGCCSMAVAQRRSPTVLLLVKGAPGATDITPAVWARGSGNWLDREDSNKVSFNDDPNVRGRLGLRV